MSTLRLSRESIYNAFYRYGLFIVFGVLVLVFSLLNANFFSPANAVNLLQQTASTGISAAGLVFVLVSGGIDISMGSTIFLSSVIVTRMNSLMHGLRACALIIWMRWQRPASRSASTSPRWEDR